MSKNAESIASNHVCDVRPVDAKNAFSHLQVRSIANGVGCRVVVVMAAISVRSVPVKVLHSKVKALKPHHKLSFSKFIEC